MISYEINKDTLAIIPKNSYTTIIYEINNKFIVNDNTYNILDNSCKYYGSTFNGRKIASSNILKVNYKLPILIEESSNMVFFPTSSIRYNKSSWVSLNNIKRYEKNYRGTKVFFINNQSIIIPISYNIFNNQVLRSSRLIFLLKERKINNLIKNNEKY